MKISLMLIITCAIVTLGGVGEEALRSLGIKKRQVIFFLVCVLLLNRFSFSPTDEIEVSAGCVYAAIWLFGNAFSGKWVNAVLVFPYAIAISSCSAALSASNEICISLFSVALCLLSTAVFGIDFGLSCAGLIPVFSRMAVYTYSTLQGRYSSLELTESCLTVQLLCIIMSVVFQLIFKRRTYVQTKMHERTN